jgi:hypothetical protein
MSDVDMDGGMLVLQMKMMWNKVEMSEGSEKN